MYFEVWKTLWVKKKILIAPFPTIAWKLFTSLIVKSLDCAIQGQDVSGVFLYQWPDINQHVTSLTLYQTTKF